MNLSGRTVLVVEDDALVRMGLALLLESWGAKVLTAASRDEAVERAAAGPSPDLLLADLNLGEGGSGLEAIERVRALSGAVIPAVVLTGQGGAHDGGEGVVFLLKPAQPDALRRAMSALLTAR